MKTSIVATALFLFVHLPVIAQEYVVHKPGKMAIDSKDNLYVSIRYGIVRITPQGKVEMITDRRFDHIAIDRQDNIYVAESEAIYRLVFRNNGEAAFETYAGLKNTYGPEDGKREAARFNAIEDLQIGPDNELYILEKAIYFINKVNSVPLKSGRFKN